MSAILMTGSVLSDMHSNKGAVGVLDVKHTTLNTLNGYDEKLWCENVKNPLFPYTQYTAQLVYPTVGKAQELGVSPFMIKFEYGI